MNYSRNISIRNKRRLRNIIISWLIVLVIGFMIGFGIGKVGQADSVEALAQFSEVEPYGTIDGKTFNWGLAENWKSGAELGFIPLEVELDEELQEFIYCLSYGYNIDYAFVMGLIEAESTYQVDVVSSTNDYGLMQINTVNHEWLKEKLGVTDFLDPYQNTRSGIYILRNLFEKYEDPEKVLMAYNMGETGAKRLWDKGIYETDYTNKVIKNIMKIKNYINERMENNE
jgi:hypothetical protein